MKYLVIGCCILAVLLTACIVSGIWIDGATSQTGELLQQAQSAALAGNTSEATAYARHARQHWQEQQNILSSILNHDELDEIESVFAKLVVCDPVGDSLDFQMHCAQLINNIQCIADMGRPSLPNIL